MPRARATWRASSTASVPQQLPNRFVGSSASCRGQTRMVIPTTSHPRSTSRAAATDESTPPLIPTTIRSAITLLVSWISRRAPRIESPAARSRSRCAGELVPGAEQVGQALELVRCRVADLDLTLSLVADDPHAGHEALLQRFLERRQLD